MKLYFSPGACSLSPHIVLLEAGLPHTVEKVDLRSKQTAGGADFRRVSPKGYVPALETDGGVLTEGPAIVQYLSDLAPGKQLLAAPGTMARYQAVAWLNFISTEIHKSYSPLFNPSASDAVKDFARTNLALRYGYLNMALEGRDYLMDSYGVADIYLFVVTNWAAMVKLDMAPFPHVMALYKRVQERPAVQEALRAEGLLK